MVKRASIEFTPSHSPITGFITKFGGQPVWFSEPQWPISKSLGRPMQFICQIKLVPELFGETYGKMAYIFMSPDGDDGEWIVDDTWQPDSGENAVIIQPGHPTIVTQPLTIGPSLFEMVEQPGQQYLKPKPLEYATNLTLSEDPDYVPHRERRGWDEAQWTKYGEALSGNKLGGVPNFIQNEELPIQSKWYLLIQLDSAQVPFYINFGDAGIGYAFISEDGRVGKFLWQCY